MKKLLIKVLEYLIGSHKDSKVIHPLQKRDHVMLGDKQVKIRKLTPALWKELFATVDQIPGLIVTMLLLPRNENFYETIVVMFESALQEIIKVVAVLSGLEEDYLNKEVGLSELMEYLTLTFQKNDFNSVIKNVKSLLPKQEKANE